MSALGQKPTLERASRMSALPPKADIAQQAKTTQCTGHSSGVADVLVSLRVFPRLLVLCCD
jgi:hypothetical protein